ncbi:MAG: hypothetical protein [Bacteriophage sp.]|nr:MAG: hypothetical protein [Bacteriophage sp.]
MAFNPNTIHGQMRLLTGDFSSAGDDPWLSDDLYLWFYQQANNSILDGSIAALESIINQVALRPVSVTNADVKEVWTGTVAILQARLVSLKAQRQNSPVPIVIKSDRKNWNDFNDLFGNDCH